MAEVVSLTKRKENNMSAFEPRNLEEAMTMAKALSQSGLIPQAYKNKPNDVFVAIIYGRELGLAPLQALQNIANINGRPSVWGDALLAIVQNHPDCEDIKEYQENGVATCEVKRRGRSPVIRTFSQQDATKAGLWGRKGPWSTYPDRMLQMRARGFALRDAFADALRGIITAEEAQDIPVSTRQKPSEVLSGVESAKQVMNAEPEFVSGQSKEGKAHEELYNRLRNAVFAATSIEELNGIGKEIAENKDKIADHCVDYLRTKFADKKWELENKAAVRMTDYE
jgi:hypothetical protein